MHRPETSMTQAYITGILTGTVVGFILGILGTVWMLHH